MLSGRDWGLRWTPLEVDLVAHGGERVTVRLELVPEVPVQPEAVAFFGSPRIAHRAQKQ